MTHPEGEDFKDELEKEKAHATSPGPPVERGGTSKINFKITDEKIPEAKSVFEIKLILELMLGKIIFTQNPKNPKFGHIWASLYVQKFFG